MRSLALVGVVAFLWMWHYQMWSRAAWSVPLDYSGDSHEMLTRIKAASEGDTWPLFRQVISRLGAPWGAHWNAYPTPDKILVLAIGGLARIVGLALAANLAVLVATLSSGLAFYAVARRFSARWEWAFAGAILFAFTYSVFHRGLAHLLLLFTWTVPLGLLCCSLIARRKPLVWKSREMWFCLAIAASLGASSPYNLFFWCQLLLWALAVNYFRHRCPVNLLVGLACIAVAGIGFFVVHAEFWLYTHTGGWPLLQRNYGGTEVYALKLVEMFVPPTFHRWDWMAFFGNRYVRWSDWRGEAFLPYLGLVGMAGFFWLGVDSIRRVLTGRAPAGPALQLGWILSYCTLGGITNVLALYLGFQIFRATNRISAFVACIVLFFVVARLSRLTCRMRRGWSLSLAAAVAAIGVLDQIPRQYSTTRHGAVAAKLEEDRNFGARLEAALPKGAMVFQLPILGFPEVAAPHQLQDYELFRPYLHTTSLRFSYGAAKFRSRSRWQRDLEGLPLPEMINRIERYGFSALYLNRRGFADQGESILTTLNTLGYTSTIGAERGDQVAVLLRPAAAPEIPLGRTLTPGTGWYSQIESDSEAAVRWSYGSSSLTYFNPFDRPLVVRVQFRLSGAGPRTVVLKFRGKSIAEMSVNDSPSELPPVILRLRPGVNRVEVSSPEPALRRSEGRSQLRSIGLHDVTVTAQSPAFDERGP